MNTITTHKIFFKSVRLPVVYLVNQNSNKYDKGIQFLYYHSNLKLK